jgi:hypothetical protein
MRRTRVLLLALATVLGAASPARAQTSDHTFRILRLESTPVGALPPIALPMPASRDNDYWAARVAVGQLRGGDPERLAIGGGLDFQWRGGSAFGLTAGYRERDCDLAGPDCGGHAMFGALARLNFITGGPTVAALIGDYTATSTLGAELGLGYSPRILPDMNACTVDLGAPFSVSMLQRVRVTTFVKPGLVLDVRCSAAGPSSGLSFLGGMGVAVQQLAARGLDLHLGVQRIFRRGVGYAIGATLSYTRVP